MIYTIGEETHSSGSVKHGLHRLARGRTSFEIVDAQIIKDQKGKYVVRFFIACLTKSVRSILLNRTVLDRCVNVK